MAEFQLERESEKDDLRSRYKRIVRELWEEFTPEQLADEAWCRRRWRHERPEETYRHHWSYRVWREEVNRVMGKPIRRRSLKTRDVMKSVREWCVRKKISLRETPQQGGKAQALL